MFLKVLQNLLENTCARANLLLTSFKKRHWHRRFPKNFGKISLISSNSIETNFKDVDDVIFVRSYDFATYNSFIGRAIFTKFFQQGWQQKSISFGLERAIYVHVNKNGCYQTCWEGRLKGTNWYRVLHVISHSFSSCFYPNIVFNTSISGNRSNYFQLSNVI